MRVRGYINPVISGGAGAATDLGDLTSFPAVSTTSFTMTEGVSVSSTLSKSGTYRVTIVDSSKSGQHGYIDGIVSKVSPTGFFSQAGYATNMGFATEVTTTFVASWPDNGFLTFTFTGVTGTVDENISYSLELRVAPP